MSYKTIGNCTCKKCGKVNVDPEMTDISDDDIHGSLIYCIYCEDEVTGKTGKWVKWC